MICMELHEHVKLLETGLQTMFVVCFGQKLDKLMLESHNTNMIRT